jgi:hypothetical protein
MMGIGPGRRIRWRAGSSRITTAVDISRATGNVEDPGTHIRVIGIAITAVIIMEENATKFAFPIFRFPFPAIKHENSSGERETGNPDLQDDPV